MSIQFDKLIDKDMNVYEKTCVAIKEAQLISDLESKEDPPKERDEKLVSRVLNMVLNDEVEYTKGDE